MSSSGVRSSDEDRRVEQRPGEHLVIFHRLRDVVDVDAGPHRPDRRLRRAGTNSTSHNPRERAHLVGEIDQAAAEAANGRQLHLARPDRLAERCGRAARGRAPSPPRHPQPQADGADAWPMRDVGGVRKAFPLGIDDEVDGALPPPVHLFDRCRPARAKPSAEKRRASSPALSSSTANSMNSMPSGSARSGVALRAGECAAAARGAARRPAAISERRPSMATWRAEPARNWSLNISSERWPS